jgi:hypothetical protein
MPERSSKTTGEPRIGKLPPRYGFMLNPFPQTRLSRCPKCERLTFPRKFALLIHVEGWGPYVQGKTCKYCARCELIMCQQDELEEQLTQAFLRLGPDLVGNEYVVLGTVATRVWKRAVRGATPGLGEALEHVAQFKGYHDLRYDPGGWRHADAPPRFLDPVPPETSWRSRRANHASADPSQSALRIHS